jgi:hypothetical protein
MKYCELRAPTPRKNLRNLFYEYFSELDIEKIFVPPPDILYKVGYSVFNDDGVIRKDYEVADNVNSGFLYQNFLSQPMTPREVWVPGKAIKINNLFWMIVARQFLQHDSRYPSYDYSLNWERIKKYLGQKILRFDVSGFGLQYPKQILIVLSEVITELYPNSLLDEELAIFKNIIVNYDVQMPNGLKIKTKRGIGLGYYEDLKTIGVIAILAGHNVLSLYGDQGLLVDRMHTDEILRQYGFVIKPDKIELIYEPKLRWGGVTYTKDGYEIPRTFSDGVISSLFMPFHWEKKNGLRSLSKTEPWLYSRYCRRLSFLYERFFGNEFFTGDQDLNFVNGGVRNDVPVIRGDHKLYEIEDNISPMSDLKLDLQFFIPVLTPRKSGIPMRIAKDFSKLRRRIYKSSIPSYETNYHYMYPRIEYNKEYVPVKRHIPGWADILYATIYGCTTGTMVYDLKPEEIIDSFKYQLHSRNPMLAKARGGYSIITKYRSIPFMSESDRDASEAYSSLASRFLPMTTRSDLVPSMSEALNPVNINSDLFSANHTVKRAIDLVDSASDATSLEDREEFINELHKKVRNSFYEAGDPKSLIEQVKETVNSLYHPELPVIEEDFTMYDEDIVCYNEDSYESSEDE